MTNSNGRPTILKVEDLATRFHTPDGTIFAVNGVSFNLKEGETLGVVGESGCGKSVTMLSLLQLIPTPPGEIAAGKAYFHDNDLLMLKPDEIRGVRGSQIGMVFQDPMTSLNPVLTIGRQVSEPLILHLKMNKKEADDRVVELLRLVGIPEAEKRLNQYPHQFSGGMRQRVMIAMALSCNPKILIADAPTTALDVTIQAQILKLMGDLKDSLNTAIIMITHDLGVIADMADRVMVMYTGLKVEEAPVDDLYDKPLHPYTIGLMASIPRVDSGTPNGESVGRLEEIPGVVPSLRRKIIGCTFAPRCKYALDHCRRLMPPLEEKMPGHWAACWETERVEADRRNV